MPRLAVTRLFALAAAMALWACLPARADDSAGTLQAEQVLSAFHTVVFIPEGAPSDGSLRADGTVPLFRWTEEIRWGFDAPPGDPGDEAALRRFADAAGRIAGLPTPYSTDPLEGGSRFFLAPRDQMARLPFGGGRACVGSMGTLAEGPNIGAPLSIGIVDQALPTDHRRHCLAEHFAQSLGLSGASLIRMPLIRGGATPELTPLGALLLKVLYDPRLRPGMTDAEAMPIVRAIIAEMDL